MKKNAGIAAVMIAAASSTCVSPSGEGRQRTASCLVTTRSGDVQGADRGASCAFLGIPFAAPPVSGLRWKPPQRATPWASATLIATAEPQSCPSVNPPGTSATQGNEDCLKLNIWTPHPLPTSPAPVIVWIHAGAFIASSANAPAHNGQKMAERTGAIIVAVNYRLGPFGFLGHRGLTAEDAAYPSSGNYGFLDQRAALAWVHDHIAAFGGNPDNVTIAGQSAGAHSVSLHLVSPGSARYFGRAIMQSGYASTRWRTLADAEALGNDFAAALGCTDPAQVLECMRSKTRDQVLLALPSGQQQFAETSRAPWGPVVDGLDIPDQPRTLYEHGSFSHVPLIVGATKDEGWTYVDRSFPAGLSAAVYAATVETEFGSSHVAGILQRYNVTDFPAPKRALAQLAGDVEAVCEARRIARLVERTRTPVYLYSFERQGGDAAAPDRVTHGLDTNFVFGNNFDRPSLHILNDADLALFGAMSGYWTRFGIEGNPNRDDAIVVRWPAFTHPDGQSAGEKNIVFDWPIRDGKRWRDAQCDFWEPFFLRSVVGSVPAWQHSVSP
jgi:para-nitrobenzyl esterase